MPADTKAKTNIPKPNKNLNKPSIKLNLYISFRRNVNQYNWLY
jgi:hypothetical protein